MFILGHLCFVLFGDERLLKTSFLLTELQGKPYTGVGSCSLLLGLLPTQGLTQVSYTAGRFFMSEPPGKPAGSRKSVGLCLSRASTQVSPFQVLCFSTEDQLRLLIQSFVTLPVLLSNFRPNFQLRRLPSCRR